MKEIFRNIKIVPVKKVLIHERTVPKWVQNLASSLENSGIQKNPIIVHKTKSNYIVLDGMHRVEAFKLLECRDIMVYEVDYYDKNIELGGWDGIILDRFDILDVMHRIFPKNIEIRKERRTQDMVKLLKEKKILFGIKDRSLNKYSLRLKEKKLPAVKENRYLDLVISALERLEHNIDNRNHKILYVPEHTSEADFQTLKASTLIYRPVFTKKDIIQRTLTGKIYPRKSTRHLIPGRPLRVDINLTILKENISLAVKNQLLASHLMWCFKSNRIRLYPESVYVFAD
ncbi:MAG: ParB N-terminal domain-containing protein [Spirochaetes bacterium]|nr:ParB N-terminal domain-containing protein [Spirochaetota bacterium]